MSQRKKMLETDVDRDFYLYFDLMSLNSKMPENEQIVLIENINKRSFGTVEIYNYNGQLLEKFPTEQIKNIKEDIFYISPNTNMLIKIYSGENEVTYYYNLKIAETGAYTLKDVCYTLGEYDESKREEVYDEYNTTNDEYMEVEQ